MERTKRISLFKLESILGDPGATSRDDAILSRLAISSASFNFFSKTLYNNLPVARAKHLGQSMKKTTSCKTATELPG